MVEERRWDEFGLLAVSDPTVKTRELKFDGADLEDSNCFAIGSDEDKAARKTAAGKEPAWATCGREAGVEVWRIENFKVVPVPRESYGRFHKGDSYIVLHTVAHEEYLSHDIFFWIGENTTMDEAGTAAYKTVELDDFFDTEPSQHREVQGKESAQFQKLFKTLSYLEGGFLTGFNPDSPEEYMSRLLQVRRTKEKGTRITEVKRERASLNHGDTFILDAGRLIYLWNGDESSAFEKAAANVYAEELEGKRCGKSNATHDIDAAFWELLGGEGEIKSAADVVKPEEDVYGEGVLYTLSDDSGRLTQTEVARGELKTDMLDTNNVMLLNTTHEIFLWLGKESSPIEQRNALRTAMVYVKTNDMPNTTAIHVFKEGQKINNEIWKKTFSN